MYCPLIKSERECNPEQCDWKPRPGQPIEAPTCVDTNKWPQPGAPFSCDSYVELNQCGASEVKKICAVTCDSDDFCPGVEFSCQYKEEPTTPEPEPECPSDEGVIATSNGAKCRCDREYVCEVIFSSCLNAELILF